MRLRQKQLEHSSICIWRLTPQSTKHTIHFWRLISQPLTEYWNCCSFQYFLIDIHSRRLDLRNIWSFDLGNNNFKQLGKLNVRYPHEFHAQFQKRKLQILGAALLPKQSQSSLEYDLRRGLVNFHSLPYMHQNVSNTQ